MTREQIQHEGGRPLPCAAQEAFRCRPDALSDDENTILSAMALQKGEAEAGEIFRESPEHLADYVLAPEISSAQETAIDHLRFIMNREEAVRLIPYVNLFNYGETVIHEDNAVLSPYGLLHRADYQPMLTPVQETQKMEMKMK